MTDQPSELSPLPSTEPDLVDVLRRLALLRDRDVLTEPEFQQVKARVVNDLGPSPPGR